MEVKNLIVSINGKTIIKRANFIIKRGDVSLVVGPNGSGKTSLIQAIIGNPKYKIISGKIIFEGIDITHLDMVERVKLGIAAAFQFPPKLKGVKLGKLANGILIRRGVKNPRMEVYKLAAQLNLIEFLDRDLNIGFSGGEMKRAELFLTILQRPKLALFDEIDSGVDIENVSLMARVLNRYIAESGVCVLLVTHSAAIARYLNFSNVYIVVDGMIRKAGNPEEILDKIREHGSYDFVGGME